MSVPDILASWRTGFFHETSPLSSQQSKLIRSFKFRIKNRDLEASLVIGHWVITTY